MTPVRTGYRPTVGVHDNYQTSVAIEFIGADQLLPGESIDARVSFITPHVYPRCLWPARELAVFEGTRKVGSFRVREVVNQSLVGNEQSFSATWSLPPELTDRQNDA